MDIITAIELRIEIIPVVGMTRMTRKGRGLKIINLIEMFWDRPRPGLAGTGLLKSVTMTGLEEPLPLAGAAGLIGSEIFTKVGRSPT